MRPTPASVIHTYRQNLERYEADGDEVKARIERALIARLLLKIEQQEARK